jgi:hypothetical protein
MLAQFEVHGLLISSYVIAVRNIKSKLVMTPTYERFLIVTGFLADHHHHTF